MVRTLEYRMKESHQNSSIRSFLKERGYSTTLINALKQTDHGIKKNGSRVFVNELVSTGDLLEICIEEHPEEEKILPMPYPIHILYEDSDILVVNKPSGMPIHPSINNYENTLANAIAYYFMEQKTTCVFRCINRLDRDTTGATIVAKHALSASILSDQVKERKIHRTYLALVEGSIKQEGVVDLPIGRKEGSVIERTVDCIHGKRAVTHFKRLERIKENEDEISLIELKLETGRTHQIRVHMAYLGHPLLGDFLYNPKCKRMKRQALHSTSISFTHPITGEDMTIDAPLPEDMKELLKPHIF